MGILISELQFNSILKSCQNKNGGKMEKETLGEFEGCKWLWYDHYGFDDVNVYMLARKEFVLNKVPKISEIKITADSRYKLYVNGKYVFYGPARGFPESYPFDRVNVGPYLKKGRNVIGVIVHQYGHGTFQSIYAGAGGLLVSGTIGRVDIRTGPGSWLVKKCQARKQNMIRRTLQIGYQENFDARKEENSWFLPAGKIVKKGKNGWGYGIRRAVGCAPWFTLEEREMPLSKEEIKNFKKVLFSYYGNCDSNWENSRNLTEVYLKEQNGIPDFSKVEPHSGDIRLRRVENPGNMFKKNSSFATISKFPSDKRLTLIIDFGEEVTGFLGIEVEGNGGEVIDFTTAEALENNWLCVKSSEEGCKVAVSDRCILKKGKQIFETFSIHGFRYMALTIRNVKNPLKIHRLYVRQTSYFFEEKTIFETSDSLINKIWDMCIRTQICCSLDAYVDCPWREQAQWWGDARVQAANTYYAFGDMRLFRRGIKQCGQSQLSNGLTYGHFPTIAVGCILPDFTLTWIHTHLDYYKYTGDKSLMKEQFDKMQKAMKFFSDYIEKNYLLGPMPEWWVFLDWAPLYKEGWSCLFNLIYLSSLRVMAEISGILKNRKEKRYYLKQAEIIEKRIKKIFWDEKEKVFWDGYDIGKKKVVKKLSQHVHSQAILLDIEKSHHRYWAEKILIPPMKLESLKHPEIIEASTFYCYYVIEALKKVTGYEEEIINFIKRRWGKMLEEGATTCYEVWNPNPGRTSLCHAWSAHPIVHFLELIAGIKPVSPNWKKIKSNPNPLNFKNVKVSIPNRRGNGIYKSF